VLINVHIDLRILSQCFIIRTWRDWKSLYHHVKDIHAVLKDDFQNLSSCFSTNAYPVRDSIALQVVRLNEW